VQTVRSVRHVSSSSCSRSNNSSRPRPKPRRQRAAARTRVLLLHKRLKRVQPGEVGRAGTVMAGLRQQANTVKSRGRLRARTRRIA